MDCKHEEIYSVNGVIKCFKCGAVVPAPWEKKEEEKPKPKRRKKE